MPFAVTDNAEAAIIAAFDATVASILVVGGNKNSATRVVWCMSARENFIITAGGGGIAYGLGLAFDQLLHT